MKNFYCVLISLFILTGCQESDKVQKVEIDNTYSLELPSFLEKATNLNEDASLQYQHLIKEFYVIVIDETKKEVNDVIVSSGLAEQDSVNLKVYTNVILDAFKLGVTIKTISALVPSKINGLNANTVKVEGVVEGLDVFYTIGFIEGKANYYQVMTWTLGSRKDTYSEKMDKLVRSFKEI